MARRTGRRSGLKAGERATARHPACSAPWKPLHLALLGGAVALQFALQSWFALSHSSAFDEPFFIAAGLRLCTTGRDPVLIDQPPVAKRIFGLASLMAGARRTPPAADYMGAWTLYHLNRTRARDILLSCRGAAIALSLALTLASAAWAAEIWGPAAGLLAAWFLALEPTTLAHGSLATADVPLSLFLLLFARSFWRLRTGQAGRFGPEAAGFWAGLAAGTKYSALGYVPALAVAVVAASRARGRAAPSSRILPAAARMLLAALVGSLWRLARVAGPSGRSGLAAAD